MNETDGIDWKEPRWIVVYSRPQSAWIAYAQLLNQKYDVFLPTYQERGSNKVHPLFGRYLFCDVQDKPTSPVRGTYGVCRILSADGHTPAIVPHGLIRALKREHERGIVMEAPLAKNPRKGDVLRIFEGPATDVKGTVIEVRYGEVRLRVDNASQTCALWVAMDKCGAVTAQDRTVR